MNKSHSNDLMNPVSENKTKIFDGKRKSKIELQ